MIKRTILRKDKNAILQLYKSLVRPQLEYLVQAWNPYQKKLYTTFRKGTSDRIFNSSPPVRPRVRHRIDCAVATAAAAARGPRTPPRRVNGAGARLNVVYLLTVCDHRRRPFKARSP